MNSPQKREDKKPSLPREPSPNDPYQNLTFFELFSHFCQQNKLSHQDSNTKGSSYTIYEDLTIILALNQNEHIHSKDFKNIEESKQVQRSTMSIKDRYNDFLKNLNHEDMHLISSHLKEHGCIGFLQFSTQEPRHLTQILLVDPKLQTQQQFKRRAGEPLENEKSPKKKKGDTQDKIIAKSKYDRFTLEDLDDILQVISNWKRISKPDLVDKLDKLCGNLADLDDYLATLDETKCWEDEDDCILISSSSPSDPSMKLLIKKKGLDRVKRRVKYLGLNLCYEL